MSFFPLSFHIAIPSSLKIKHFIYINQNYLSQSGRRVNYFHLIYFLPFLKHPIFVESSTNSEDAKQEDFKARFIENNHDIS